MQSPIIFKGSQGRYEAFYQAKEIDLDNSEQLENFRLLTRPGGVGCLVENLTFLRYVGLENGGNRNLEANRNILVDCLRNLKLNLASKRLSDLALDVRTKYDTVSRVAANRSMWDERTWDAPNTPPNPKASTNSPHRRDWKATWNLSSSLYRETMAALHETELPVKRLSVFGDTENCSLGFDQLASCPEQDLPSTSLATVEDLSLSLSHSVEFATNDEATDPAGPMPTSHVRRLETFLQLCPKLAKLDLHFFKIWSGREETQSDMLVQERQFFDRIADSMTFPNLKSCILRGISCRSISLHQFLESAPQLQHVEIIKANLTDGQWSLVFDALCDRKLELLHLDDLSEGGIVYFLGVPGEPKLVSEGQRHGTDELTRSGMDTALPSSAGPSDWFTR